MKIPRIANAIGHIDDELVSGAATSRKTKKNIWLKWGAIAACFAVLVIAGAAILPSLPGGDGPISGRYKYQISGLEADMEWPWEYKTNSEKYPVIEFGGKKFNVKSFRAVGTEYLGDMLGTCEAEGVDSYTNKKYTEIFEVRTINGVSKEKMVAAGNDSGFYVYAIDEKTKPATFGEALDLYGLSQNLEFCHFTKYEGYDDEGYFILNDDAYIWEILLKCRDAVLYNEADSFDRSNRSYLAFTATSDALGVYKRVIYISEDGYFATNIFDYSYICFIGEDAAGKIISYAKNSSTEAKFEPYELTIAGTLTEIGDGYVLIDDTVMCANPENGVVYKVFTDDFRMKRCIEYLDIKVGDIVGVKYEGVISDSSEVSGAYSIYKGKLVDGDIGIPE